MVTRMNDKKDPANRWRNPWHVDPEHSEHLSHSLLLGNKLREKITDGWALGTFLIELPTPSTLTAMAFAGFDFVVLDMEHSPFGFSTLQTLITAGHAAGLPVLVRTWGQDTGLIGKVLDMGANGIMAPHVATPERARAIVEQTRFKPVGDRGFSPLMKYDSLSEPFEQLGEGTYVVVQIEGKDALKQVEDIAAVPGLDAIFVGPYDLALSLGVPPGSPEVARAAEQLAATLPKHLSLGIYIDDPATCADWAARRFALQCVSFDGRMLSDGARRLTGLARRGFKPEDGGN